MDALIVDTDDMSEHPLPKMTDLAPLLPEATPRDYRPDPCIIPQYWEDDNNITVFYKWTATNRVLEGEYLYNANTDEFIIK